MHVLLDAGSLTSFMYSRCRLVCQAHLLTVEHVTSLRSLFELQDTEHIGALSASQLLQLLHACGETQLNEADMQATLNDISQPTSHHLTAASTSRLHPLTRTAVAALQPATTTRGVHSRSAVPQ